MKTVDLFLGHPLALFIILLIGAGFGIAVEKLFAGFERDKRRAYWQGRNSADRKKKAVSNPGASNLRVIANDKDERTVTAAEQLKTVMNAAFKRRPLLNKPERRLLECIDKALDEHSPGWRAMGQVSLGEVLYTEVKDAYWAINAKRVDLLIVDADCHPLYAIEFQGTGHHLGAETAARDAVKKEALRRAGIGYVEVVSGDTPAEVREMIRKLVQRSNS